MKLLSGITRKYTLYISLAGLIVLFVMLVSSGFIIWIGTADFNERIRAAAEQEREEEHRELMLKQAVLMAGTWEETIDKFAVVAGLGILIISGLTILLGMLTSRALVSPLLRLSDAARGLQNGRRPDPITIKGDDELAEFAAIFNEMAFYIFDYTRRLETAVQEKMDELKQNQSTLFHASRLTQLGEMAAGVAHEINQPLNIIKLASQSLVMDSEEGIMPPLQPRVAEALSRIDGQVGRIADVIDHMRVFARRDSSSKDTRPVNISEPVKGVLSLVGEQLRLRGIRVETVFEPGTPEVSVNPNRLEQVFMNLITNARDAMEDLPEDREKVLSISAMKGEDGRAVVEISDTGTGISEDIRDRIFDPFFTTKPIGKGTGLGLSISQSIIGEYGGSLAFRPVGGAGAVFAVSLPPSGAGGFGGA